MTDATAIARALCVAPAVAARWIRQGMPADADAARLWLAQGKAEMKDCPAGGTIQTPPRPPGLAEERTRLFREQADAVALRNALARKEYAPIQLLTQVLATASQAVSERLEHLPGVLKRECPEMTSAQRDAVMRTIASARNEWVRATAELVVARLDELAVDDAADEAPAP